MKYLISPTVSAGDPADTGKGNKDAKNPVLGSVMILAAQLIVACQMITEQKFISQYDVPALQVCTYSVVSLWLLQHPIYVEKVHCDSKGG